jgi:isopentenyldiphosphate isomerase
MAVKWASIKEIQNELIAHSDSFTPWFRLSLEGLLKSPLAKKYGT